MSDASSTVKDLISGTVAGAGQLLVGYPLDTAKVKLQPQPGKYSGATDAAHKIYATHGVRGFFKGLSAPLVTVAAFNAVLFAAKGSMERLLAHTDGSPLTIRDHLLCGAGAGVASSLIACPTELIKCRLQARSGFLPQGLTPAVAVSGIPGAFPVGSSAPASSSHPSSPVAVIRQVVAAGGVRGLYKGMVPTLGREIGGSAVMFATFAAAKQQLAHAQGIEIKELGQPSLLLAGGLAGISFWLAIYPLDTAKSKLQTDDLHRPRFKGTLDCMRQIVAERGVSSLFCGFPPALIRAAVANAAAFALFENCQKALA